jgi:hypothetical protein
MVFDNLFFKFDKSCKLHITFFLHNFVTVKMTSTVSDSFGNQNTREARRGRKESHAWDHFFKEPLGSGHYIAKCYYCKPEILKSHLALYCKEVPLFIKTEYMEMLAVGITSTNRRQKSDTNSSAELIADKKDKIDQALI